MQQFFTRSPQRLAVLLFGFLPVLLMAQPKIQLQQFATGFSKPIDIAHCGDSRLFIAEQRGIIWIVDSLGVKQTTPFLDIDARVNSSGNEQGLLGLAFPPNYKTTGYFYVNYIQANGDTRVSRFSVLPGDSTKADPNSEAIMINIDQPFSNHNGGCMKFGPDGYLYFTQGDGGSGGDPNGNGQNNLTMLGKMMRINVNLDTLPYYTIPADNPFANDASYLPEIWSTGLRNTWRFSFDRLTGDIWLGDVGQNIQEEIDFEPANTGGRNYGWRCYEASLTYNTNGCLPISNYTFPVFEYQHSAANGCSITGGYIYRGTKYQELYGKYIFPDYCSGRWWVITHNSDGTFTTAVLANLSAYEYSSLGEDKNGELYVCAHVSGKIFKIRELCSGYAITGVSANATCTSLANGSAAITVTGGTAPFTYTWSNGATTSSISNLVPGQYTVAVQDASQCMRRDTFVVQETAPVTGVPSIYSVGNTGLICDGGSLTLQATAPTWPGATYIWYKNGTVIADSANALITTSGAGLYSVQWQDSVSGCTTAISNALEVIDETITSFGLTYENGVITPDAPVTGQWYLDGVLIPGAIDSTYMPLETGYYAIVVTSENGCTFTTGIQVTVSGTVLPVGIQRLTITPNPTSSVVNLYLQLNVQQEVTVQFSDVSGKIIAERIISGNMLNERFNLTGLPAGEYLCSILLKNGKVVRKVVKQ